MKNIQIRSYVSGRKTFSGDLQDTGDNGPLYGASKFPAVSTRLTSRYGYRFRNPVKKFYVYRCVVNINFFLRRSPVRDKKQPPAPAFGSGRNRGNRGTPHWRQQRS